MARTEYVIDRNRDAAFLREEELDLMSYHKFEHGDRVVVCAACNHVHLAESWAANSGICPDCGGPSTRTIQSLNELTQVRHLSRPGRRTTGRSTAGTAAAGTTAVGGSTAGTAAGTTAAGRRLRPIRPLGEMPAAAVPAAAPSPWTVSGTYVIDRNRDRDFLQEESLDLRTYHRFVPGDAVVVCAACGSVHLERSWQEAGSRCPNCNHAETRQVSSLNELAQVTPLRRADARRRNTTQTGSRTGGRSRRRSTAQSENAARPAAADRSASAGNGGTVADGTRNRRRRFRPFRVLVTILLIFLLFNPVKDFILGRFFAEAAEEGQEQEYNGGADYEDDRNEEPDEMPEGWVDSRPLACIVSAPQCNVRTSPEVTDDNVIAQLSWGTPVNWTDAMKNEETGTAWFYVTAEDGSGITGWVSGKVLELQYDVEVYPHSITAPVARDDGEATSSGSDLIDGYCMTAWHAADDGTGAEVTLEYDEAVIRCIKVTNGDVSSKEAYAASNRIQDIEFIFDNGESFYTTIDDVYRYDGVAYSMDTDTPSTSVTIRVNSVYEGEEDPHLAISTLAMYTTGIASTVDEEGWR